MKAAGHESIDAYIEEFPPKGSEDLQKIRKTVPKAAPDAAEAMASTKQR